MQPGGPQILIGTLPGAVAPAQRAGRLGLGFNPVILDWDSFTTQLRAYQEAAGAAQGPVVVRVNGTVTAAPLGDGRIPLTGSVKEVRDDVARAAELGVDEVFWGHIAANVPHRGLLDALNSIADLRGASRQAVE